MRTLKIQVDQNLRASIKDPAGFAGEHNATRIVAGFPDGVPEDVEYYRMVFELPDGTFQQTDALTPANNEVAYTLPQSLTSAGGTLRWQLCGYRTDGETVLLLEKTDTLTLVLGESLAEGEAIDGAMTSHLESLMNQAQALVTGFDLRVGSTTQLAPGEPAAVALSRSGNIFSADFSLPRGSDGQNAAYIIGVPEVVTVPLNGDGTVRNGNYSFSCTPSVTCGGQKMACTLSEVYCSNPAYVLSLVAGDNGQTLLFSQNRAMTLPAATDQFFVLSGTCNGTPVSRRISVQYLCDLSAPADTGWVNLENNTLTGVTIRARQYGKQLFLDFNGSYNGTNTIYFATAIATLPASVKPTLTHGQCFLIPQRTSTNVIPFELNTSGTLVINYMVNSGVGFAGQTSVLLS